MPTVKLPEDKSIVPPVLKETLPAMLLAVPPVVAVLPKLSTTALFITASVPVPPMAVVPVESAPTPEPASVILPLLIVVPPV